MIEMKGIVKNFGKTEVLKDVNLKIKEGEFISLVGPSGCGKSTLLRIIAGLEPASSGSVTFNARAVDSQLPHERNVAMVFQSYALYPHLTVAGNIMVPLELAHSRLWQRLPLIRLFFMPKLHRKLRAKVENVAQQLHIEHLLERRPAQLSGGQKQRVAVARMMVREPVVFLMDEPLSNLDAKLRVTMRAEIVELHRKLKRTFIYVTHDQAEAMTMSDRIAVMMDGHILQIGSPHEVYKQPEHLKVAEFIGSPKINIIKGVIGAQNQLFIGAQATAVYVEKAESEGQKVKVAIRCESLVVDEHSGWSVELAHSEYLGSELLLFCHFTDPRMLEEKDRSQFIVVRHYAHDQHFQLGSKFYIRPKWHKILLFAADGQRLDCTTELAENIA